MLLEELHDPLTSWLYAERFVGGGSRGYSVFSEQADVSPDFHPQRGRPTFQVPSFWVEDSQGAYLRNSLSSGLHELYRRDGCFLLPVHPDVSGMANLAGREILPRLSQGPPLEVIPTANTRTVAVRQIGGTAVEPHFVKLHFPRRLSRFTRRLRRPMVELQLWVADELTRIGVRFLPEVAGGVLGVDPVESWGYVLREVAPRTGPIPAYTVPLFALYSDDILNPDHPALLEQLVERSGQRPLDYVAEHIIEPMVQGWLHAERLAGCILEMHGQNTLFSFSPDLPGTAILYRDCGVYVDPAMRTAAGLSAPLPPVNVLGADIDVDPTHVRSLAYDSFMGHHVLDRIAIFVERRFGTSSAALREAARKVFADGGGAEVAMPDTVHYYDDAASVTGRGWQLADTGRPPRWR